jgi:hypothetical protein
MDFYTLATKRRNGPRIVDECRNDEFRDGAGSMIDER